MAIHPGVCQIRTGMDLTFTPEQEAFRADARAWLAAHVPSEPLPSLDTAEGFTAHRAWERVLFEDRWSVVSWPTEYGGRDAGIMEWLIFEEEYYRARAPKRVSQNGIFLLAPTMLEYGTAEQKERFLPPMASGDEVWCQGWSEPDAGSDLAGIRSRAERNAAGDGWRLTGQKTWASRGAFAQWCFGIFRTDPEAERHRGLELLPRSDGRRRASRSGPYPRSTGRPASPRSSSTRSKCPTPKCSVMRERAGRWPCPPRGASAA